MDVKQKSNTQLTQPESRQADLNLTRRKKRRKTGW